MIKKYTLNAEKKLTQTDGMSALIIAIQPEKAEIGELRGSYDFPFDYMGGILDDYENARFEADSKGNELLLLQYPAMSETGEVETYPYALINTSEGAIIFALNHSADMAAVLEREYDEKRLRHQLLYHIILKMSESFHDYLRDYRLKRHEVAKKVAKSTKNDQLLEMIQMQGSLVYFQDALTNNLEVLKKYSDYLREKGEDGFAERIYDLYVETAQARNESKIQAKLLENLRDLFSNIVANNLNIVMKIMTSATFVLGIPAVIVGFYGMNVVIPGQWGRGVVFIIAGFILLVSTLVSWILRKKDMM